MPHPARAYQEPVSFQDMRVGLNFSLCPFIVCTPWPCWSPQVVLFGSSYEGIFLHGHIHHHSLTLSPPTSHSSSSGDEIPAHFPGHFTDQPLLRTLVHADIHWVTTQWSLAEYFPRPPFMWAKGLFSSSVLLLTMVFSVSLSWTTPCFLHSRATLPISLPVWTSSFLTRNINSVALLGLIT